MQDKFNQFLGKYEGQGDVGDTTENKSQCVGLIEVWTDFLGLSHTWGNADDLLTNANTTYFQIIPNTPDNIPQIGDIVCFSRDFNGTVGHTGISTGIGDTNNFDLFEQNDPVGGVCQKKTYNYQFVQGWMRPILPAQPLSGTYVDKTTFDRLVNKSTQYDLFVALGYNNATEVMTKIKELTDKITELENRPVAIISTPTVAVPTPTPETVTLSVQPPSVFDSPPPSHFPNFIKGLKWLIKKLEAM
ncbi:MAG TPA: CHAP domain-containing protein [Patescibacteria group bacterium]